jgi:hypothetical protein
MAERSEVESLRDRVADELSKAYPAILNQLVQLFARVAAVDERVSHVNCNSPPSERTLRMVEVIAHGLVDGFARDLPEISRSW